jgi:squalene-associated FAD-dependent desaturase
VVVVGGGLAGITAALDCADAGASVTLVEVRPRLGGAVYSFEREGLEMDNGQHVFLRCCTAYRALLHRLGSDHLVSIQPRLEIPVLKPGSAPTLLRRNSLPAPLHLAGVLARYPHLSVRQRLGAMRAALGLMRLDPNDPRLDDMSLGDWLAAHGQDAEAVSALWDLIALPTLNLPAARASLALGVFVFRTGLLSTADAGDIGFHTGTLSEIVGAPAERALRDAGVDVRLGWGAERIERSEDGFEVHPRAGARGGTDADSDADGADGLDAETVIVAVPHARAASLLDGLLGETARGFARLGGSPIVNLHVVFDREVCSHPFAAGVGTPVQYLFDRSAAAGAPAGCQYLAVSLSGADREMEMSVDELREFYVPALRELLPRARRASVESFLVTREHAATIRAVPGSASLRPAAHTALPGLLLAGAWTDTGGPATLEGAVLSGHAAAAGALRTLALAPPPQPVAWGVAA